MRRIYEFLTASDPDHGDVRAINFSTGRLVLLLCCAGPYMVGVAAFAFVLWAEYGILGMLGFMFLAMYVLLMLLHYGTRARRPDHL